MRKTLLIVTYILCAMVIEAQIREGNTPLDSMRLQFTQEADKLTTDFEKYAKQAYEEYLAAARADFAAFENSVKQVWGGDSIVYNTRTEWVEYRADYTSRSIVSFGKGDIFVEVAITEGDEENSDKLLAKAVEDLLNSRGSTCDYKSTVDKAQPLTNRPILEGLVDFSPYQLTPADAHHPATRKTPPTPTVKGKELAITQKEKSIAESEEKTSEAQEIRETSTETISARTEMRKSSLAERREAARQRAQEKSEAWNNQENIASLATQIISQSKKTITKVKGNDGKTRKIVKVQMKLVTDNIDKKAALYKDIVTEFSQKYQIEEPLIYAIIEQESAFNPKAQSHIPAYGLMQLVPTSGGLDANRFVNGKNEAPTASYLFNPRNNIELGTAYLHMLMFRYNLRNITDTECRRLCVIAAYNTGEGNVYHSFTGKKEPCYNIINKYSYNTLYSHLTKNLSTHEARDYVEKVVGRREKYLKK